MPTPIASEVLWYCPTLQPTQSGSTLQNLLNPGTDDGTITNAIWAAQTDNGGTYAIDFDGSGDYVTVTDSATFDFGTADCWMSAWVRFESGAAGLSTMVFDKGFGGNTTRFFMLKNGSDQADGFFVGISNGATLTSWEDTWVHILMTRSGTTSNVYLNGTLASTKTTLNASRSLNNASNFIIGARSDATTSFMIGMIDDVRLGTTHPTSEQITALASVRGYQPSSFQSAWAANSNQIIQAGVL